MPIEKSLMFFSYLLVGLVVVCWTKAVCLTLG